MKTIFRLFTSATLIASLAGCASLESRKSLENVAKNWCETIRASQVICTYPLTEDLVPGDVFLVQTTIDDQSKLYARKGFLSLDDHQARLKTNYQADYFNGYWQDNYGATPHPRPSLSASSPQAVDAPRAAFPSYTFDASSGINASLALPINGIPIALGLVHGDQVSGNVVLSNAYTYAADTGSLYEALKKWAHDNQGRLGMTLIQSGMEQMLLRVVSRVYLVGGVNVTLTKSAASGGQTAVNQGDSSAVAGGNGVDMTAILNAQAESLKSALPNSGAIKFMSASSSSVTLAETFDRPLVVGYLGFDVPVFSGGVLGVPLPVFERLEGRKIGNGYPLASISPDQAAFNLQIYALLALGRENPAQALAVARAVGEKIDSPEFADALQSIAAAQKNADEPKIALNKFKLAANRYVGTDEKSGPHYLRFQEVFSAAFDQRDTPPQGKQ